MVKEWLFSLVQRSAIRQRAQENGIDVTFRLCWQIRLTVAFIVVSFGSVLLVVLTAPPIDRDPWYLRPIIVSFITGIPIGILLALPGRVITDSAGIRQQRWWRSEKHMPWSDVVSVNHNDFKEETIVYGKSSSPIVFSPYLVDRLRFEREVKTHSRRTDPNTDF